MSVSRISSFPLLILFAASCGGDFAPYNLLESLRVLAIRAEPPVVSPGESTRLDALVWEPHDQTVSYEWSWCPFTESRDVGFKCAVSEDDVQSVLDEVLPGNGSTVDFDLGREPTAALPYPGNASVLQSLCENVLARAATSVSDEISCPDGIDVTVRLIASTADESVTVIKRVPLVLDPVEATNTNPTIGPAVRIAGKREQNETNGIELASDGSDVIAAGANYRLWADITETTFESFVPAADLLTPDPAKRRESLFLTWFVTSGETDATRTSFIDGENYVDDLRENIWAISPVTEIPSRIVELFLVLRDERGGVTWMKRSIGVTEKGQ